MAFTVVTRQSQDSTDTTSHTVLLPDGSNVTGRRVIVVFSKDQTGTVTWQSGWTEFVAGNGTETHLSAAYRDIDGTEGFDGTDDSITVTTSVAEQSNHHSYRIEGFDTGQAPQGATTANGTDTNTANPPSITPSWGSAEDLLIVAAALRFNAGFTAAPTNYGNLLSSSGGDTNAPLGTAHRIATITSENPDTFTHNGGSNSWVATTIAVKPPAGATTNVDPGVPVIELVAETPTITRTGNADSGAASFTLAAQDATVLAGGNPNAETSAFTMAAEDATVSITGDSSAAPLTATMSFEAPFEAGTTADLELVSDSPIAIAFSALDATISTDQVTSANAALFAMAAHDATVTISGEVVEANAEAAIFGMTALDAGTVPISFIPAEAALISFAGENPQGRGAAGLASIGLSALDASVAVDAGTIASPDVAEFSISALNASISISGEFITPNPQVAFIGVQAYDATVTTLAAPENTYTFATPSEERHHPYYARDPYLSKFTTYTQGLSVILKDGEYITLEHVVAEKGLREGEDYFVGGYTYTDVPEDVAQVLIASGYTPTLNS